VVVATKVGPARDPAGEWLTMAPPEQLRGQVEQNCASSAGPLGRGGPASQRPHMASVTGHFGALAELRQAGLTRHLGLSNVSPQHVAEALTIAPVVCVHNSYGLHWRRADDRGLADLCRKQGIAFSRTSPSPACGARQPQFKERDARVQSVARAHDVTPAHVQRGWTLHRGPHVLAIPGTTNPAHLAENIAATILRLTEEQWTALDKPGEALPRPRRRCSMKLPLC
jgi:pyridoxine 4-dehydrogenase